MSENLTVSKIRFFEYGKEAPDGSRFKGILDESSLVGYFKYTDSKDKNDSKKEVDNVHEGGYLGYVKKDDYTFTSEGKGWLKDLKKGEFEDKLSSFFCKDGDMWWETIISFNNEEFAASLGLVTLEDYKMLIDRCLPKICKTMGLDAGNVCWWANRHIDTTHPHIHLNWIEKNKTRERGKLTDKEFNRVKNIIVTELRHIKEETYAIDKQFKTEMFKKKDQHYHELINAAANRVDEGQIKLIKDLYRVLPKSGRLSYNSYVMKPYKKAIDAITDRILEDEKISKCFDEYISMLNEINQYQNDMMSQNAVTEQGTLKKTELEKLYSRIGNMILKGYKKKDIRSVHSEQNTGFTNFLNNVDVSNPANEESEYRVFTIHHSLIKGIDDRGVFVRIPNTKGKKYMYLDKNRISSLTDEVSRYLIDVNPVLIYDRMGNLQYKSHVADIMEYWDDKTNIDFKCISIKRSNNLEENFKNRQSKEKDINKKRNVYRQPKTINYYKDRIYRWFKYRNIAVSDSSIYKDMLEWEKANNIQRF